MSDAIVGTDADYAWVDEPIEAAPTRAANNGNITFDQALGALREQGVDLDQVADALDNAAGDPLAAARGRLFKTTQLLLERVIRYGDGQAHELHFAGGLIVNLGDARKLVSQDAFRTALAGQAKKMVSRTKPEKFEALIQNLLDASEQREGADTEAQEAEAWIHAYTATQTGALYDVDDPATRKELAETRTIGAFTATDGRVFVFPEDIAVWLQRFRGVQVTARELTLRLGRAGFTARRFEGGGRRTRQYRASPAKWLEGER
jgi:hypothetical protein